MQSAQNNPFAALLGGAAPNASANGNATQPSGDPQAGTENTSPLPNPWQASSGGQARTRPVVPTAATTSSTGSTTAGSTTTSR